MIPQATMKGIIVWNMAGDRRRLWHVQDTRCSTRDRTNKIVDVGYGMCKTQDVVHVIGPTR